MAHIRAFNTTNVITSMSISEAFSVGSKNFAPLLELSEFLRSLVIFARTRSFSLRRIKGKIFFTLFVFIRTILHEGIKYKF